MRLPLSVKFSGIILAVLVISIGVITYLSTMIFYNDKTNYIFELNSITARDRGASISNALEHLQEKVQIFTRTYQTEFQNPAEKAALLNSFFQQYQEFLALYLYREDGSRISLFESRKLSSLNLDPSLLEKQLQASGLSVAKINGGESFLANATVDERLPAFAMGAPLSGETSHGKQIAVAVIDLKQIDAAGHQRGGLQEMYVVNRKGMVISHTDMTQVFKHADFSNHEIVRSLLESNKQISASTKAVKSPDGEKWIAAFSPLEHNMGGVIVAVPQSVAFDGIRTLIAQITLVAVVILFVTAFLSTFLASSVASPVKELAKATRRIARGEFNLRVKAKSKDEIGDLASSFNQMGKELLDREAALKEANNKLIQSEKMAAFGQLGAGIAHEVKNPLAGILGYAQLAMKKIPEDHAVHKNLAIIEKETKRCKEIIENLMKFARQEKATFDRTDICAVARDSLVLVEHQLTLHKVKIFREISEGEIFISGSANQLQQVLMNLMINAQHAMEPNGGELHVSTNATKDGWAEIHLRDTGCGMTEEVKKRIFEPFFTTKPAGKGTGLGLSVTFGIIADHKGEVKVESEVGKGTEFILRLPLVEVRNAHSLGPNKAAQAPAAVTQEAQA